jgi:hypothetical protein
MTEDWPTVRRFPRTIAEAFPRSVERAAAIEVGPRPLWRHVMRLIRRVL